MSYGRKHGVRLAHGRSAWALLAALPAACLFSLFLTLLLRSSGITLASEGAIDAKGPTQSTESYRPISVIAVTRLASGATTGTTTPTRTTIPTRTPTRTSTPTRTRTLTPTITPTTCGLAWRVVGVGEPSSVTNYLYSIEAIAPDDIWAVGQYAPNSGPRVQTLVEHWDGTQWSIVPSPNPGSSTNHLFDVVAISANDIWAVGYADDPTSVQWTLTEHWDGTQWRVIPSPNPQGTSASILRSVTAISTNDVWAVGYYVEVSGTIGWNRTLAMHWDGQQWTILPTPNPGPSNELYELWDVAGVSSNNVWAVGFHSLLPRNDPLLLRWDGSTWQHIPFSVPIVKTAVLYAVSAISDTDIWAVGVRDYLSFTAHWDGVEWSLVPSPNIGTDAGNTLQGVTAISKNDVWAVGHFTNVWCCPGNGTLTEHWDGKQWTIVHSPNPGTIDNLFYDVSAAPSLSSPSSPASEVWAVGQYWGGTGRPRSALTERYNDPCSTPSPTRTGTPPTLTPTPTGTPPTHTPSRTRTRTPSSTITPTSSFTLTPTATVCAVYDFHSTDTPIYLPPLSVVTSSLTVAEPGPGGGRITDLDVIDLHIIHKYIRDFVISLGSPTGTSVMLFNRQCSSEDDIPGVGFDDEAASLIACPPVEGASYRPYRPLSAFDGEQVAGRWVLTVRMQTGTHGPGTLQSWGVRITTDEPGCPSSTATPVSSSTSTSSPSPSPSPSATATPHLATATPCPLAFSDVQPSDYFYEPVRYLYCRGVISGYGDGTFRPYNNTTRGQLSKIVALAEGWPTYTPATPTFRDVPPSDPFYAFVETAYHHGIVSGYRDGSFRPGNNVTRGQSCKMIVLARAWTSYTPPTPTFRDVPPTDPFYTYIETAYSHGIISGYGCGSECLEFRTGNNATRGQICKIVYGAVAGR